MNRKGQMNWMFLAMLIFIALLAMVAIFSFKTFGGFNYAADELIPNGSGVILEKSNLGILRYDIQEDKVELYDGQNFVTFTGAKEFDSFSKSISSEEIRKEIENYYFNGERTGEREIFKNNEYIVTIYGFSKSSSNEYYIPFYQDRVLAPQFAKFWSWWEGNPTYNDLINYRRGNVILTIWTLSESGQEGQVAGFIYVGLNPSDDSKSQKMYIEATTDTASNWIFDQKPKFLDPEMNLIFLKAKLWRDSVFKDPSIDIQGKEFCIRKVGSNYLVDGRYITLDLNKAGASCSG